MSAGVAWPFVIAAYTVAILGTLGLVGWAMAALRRAERRADAVDALVGAALLAMSALRNQAAYFYTPSDAARDHVAPGSAVRLGGMVTRGSLRRAADGVTIDFVVTDGAASVPVRFSGIVPALFREGSGVVADGRFTPDGRFVADTILAKHDERYMPPEIAKGMHGRTMHKSESLKT